MADEKKMTQVEALEQAVKAIGDTPGMEDVVAVLIHMVNKRKAPRKPRVNKVAEAFREQLVIMLRDAEGPMTNAEIAATMTELLGEEVKPQRVSNNIKVLEKAGTVQRIRGEKAKDKDTFVVA